MNISSHQRDRAIGVILASAAGDALGAPYEFKPPVAASKPIAMIGGGAFDWAPGEWTDDTSMAIVILDELAKGNRLEDEATQDAITLAWQRWAAKAPDVGVQTSRVLGNLSAATAQSARLSAKQVHDETGRSAGNGSLMRTGPVAIATLADEALTAANARAISDLTHHDSEAGDACVLWCLAIRHAVLTGELDIRVGLPYLSSDAGQRWLRLIESAEAGAPHTFVNNGWVVSAFQAAWSAIKLAVDYDAPSNFFDAQRLKLGLEFAVRAGNDADTVAAIAGSLLGAKYGASAVPASWRLLLHGWPGLSSIDLTIKANLAINVGLADDSGWPGVDHFDYSAWRERFELVQHPHDSGLWLGGVGSLNNLPSEVTAVVSLCRVGTHDVPSSISSRTEVMLIDSDSPSKNLNIDFMFSDTAAVVKELRDSGHVVFLHCVQAQSRTPSVAITYSVEQLGMPFETAVTDIKAALPESKINCLFLRHLERLR